MVLPRFEEVASLSLRDENRARKNNQRSGLVPYTSNNAGGRPAALHFLYMSSSELTTYFHTTHRPGYIRNQTGDNRYISQSAPQGIDQIVEQVIHYDKQYKGGFRLVESRSCTAAQTDVRMIHNLALGLCIDHLDLPDSLMSGPQLFTSCLDHEAARDVIERAASILEWFKQEISPSKFKDSFIPTFLGLIQCMDNDT